MTAREAREMAERLQESVIYDEIETAVRLCGSTEITVAGHRVSPNLISKLEADGYSISGRGSVAVTISW